MRYRGEVELDCRIKSTFANNPNLPLFSNTLEGPGELAHRSLEVLQGILSMPPEMGTGSLNFDEGTGDALSLSPPPPPPDRTGGKPSDSSGSTCDTQQRHGHRSLKSNRRKIGVFRHPMTTLW